MIIPPLAIDGPHLFDPPFRPYSRSAKKISWPIRPRQADAGIVEEPPWRHGLNIVISGGTGAGKTTLLNVLSGYISEKERIVTIEDSAELQLKQRHVVRLETRPPMPKARARVPQAATCDQQSANAAQPHHGRARCRGEEALDMLQAMNTGHDGSMTTMHANSPRDAIARMETMAMMANLNLPEKAIRKQIVSAITLVVQVSRFSDGMRRVTQVTEITGMENEIVTMQDVFVFQRRGSFAGRPHPGNVYRNRHPAEVRRQAEGIRDRLALKYVRTDAEGMALKSD